VVPGVTALVGWPLLGQPVGAVAVVGLLVAGVGLWLGRARPPTATTRRTADRREPVPVR
jgi:hypothetical protein